MIAEAPQVVEAAANVALFVVGLALSYLSARMMADKNKNLARDDKPTTLATRGSYLPRLIGRRRIGPIFAWAGNRQDSRQKVGGKGTGGGSSKQHVFYEDGWHQLCIGPAYSLTEVESGGKIIFSGIITSDSHPSGSTIDLGDEGAFQIYWGEVDQPVNTYLGDASRVGVSSRWPQTCYVLWKGRRLGTSPAWQLMTYVVTAKPQETHLSDTTAVLSDLVTETLTGGVLTAIDIDDFVGVPIENAVLTPTDEPLFLKAGGWAKITRIADSSEETVAVKNVLSTQALAEGVTRTGDPGEYEYTIPDGHVGPLFVAVTVFEFYDEGITLLEGDTIQAYALEQNDGFNLAHCIADLWFSAWPYGIGADKSRFDMDSLEALGTLLETEDLRGSVIAIDGETMSGTLAGIHQDIGVFLPIDFTTGKLKFMPVRAQETADAHLTEDVLLERPQVRTQHGPVGADRTVFSFPDESNRYRDMTIAVTNSGQVSYYEYFRARGVQIVSTVEFTTAGKIGQRRSQEDMAGAGATRFVANRGSRLLMPGQAITADGVEQAYRVTSVELHPLSSRVVIEAIPDYYGAVAVTLAPAGGSHATPRTPVMLDPAFFPVEVPEMLLAGQPQTVIVPRIRGHNQVSAADIHISRDDETYTRIGEDLSIMQGGLLDEAISADDLYHQDDGPSFTALGDDIAEVLDLTLDETSWRNGRQIVAIGGELFYVKTIESLGGGQYRLKGLIRARYDTRPQAHGVGSPVIIFQNDDTIEVQDVLLEPQVDLWVKSQAKGNGVIPLTDVPPRLISLYGKGVRPVPVSNVCLDISAGTDGIARFSYVDGDLPIRWSYSTPQSAGTGAGQFGAGVVQTEVEPEGDFLVEILDDGDNLVRSEVVETNAYEYTEADRLADFSASEPSEFQVRVTQIRSGRSADPVTVTIENAA